MQGDCLERMEEIPDESVDLVLADPPYQKTACKWDQMIPIEPMWHHLKRILKPRGTIVLTAIQPFTSVLIHSNLQMAKQSLVWEKTTVTGHLNAKRMHMRAHEDIIVFYGKLGTYNPQMTHGHERRISSYDQAKAKSNIYRPQKGVTDYNSTSRYPRSVIKTSTDKQKINLHPTQKPVALMEYLVKTFSNERDVVLDFCAGSFTTGVACLGLERDFIGIEMDKTYFRAGVNRMRETAEWLDLSTEIFVSGKPKIEVV